MTRAEPRRIAEERGSPDLPIWVHPEWRVRFPWLVQGITSAGSEADRFDLGLFGEQPVGAVMRRWSRLRASLGVSTLVHSHQVHGTRILAHADHSPAGLLLVEGFDGHVTSRSDLVLTVSVADCVPVSLVDAEGRGVAIVHAGWRGVAGGIVEGAIELLRTMNGARPDRLWLHCGPAICGECYEVGPEVHQAVRPESVPPGEPFPIDLRAAIADRAAALGLRPEHLSVSEFCTLCGEESFFSHRGGERGRQMSFIGVRSDA